MKDSSLRVPSGGDGTIIDVHVFTRDGLEKDGRALDIEEHQLKEIKKDVDEELNIIEGATFSRLENIIIGKRVASSKGIPRGTSLKKDHLDEMPKNDWFKIRFQNEDINKQVKEIELNLNEYRENLKDIFKQKKNKI